MPVGYPETRVGMYSRCPQCDKLRKVSAKQLRDSRGLLKCKRCGQSFDALASLSEKADAPRPKPRKEPAISFEPTQTKQSPWFWGSASLLMFLVLLIQVVYFDGLRLYSQPAIHSALSFACQAVDCRLPAVNNPEEWTVSHSELQPHLDRRYWLTAALTNQAEVSQAFPKLKLTLTDFSGQALAERVFIPKQYAELAQLAANETLQIRLPLMIAEGDVGGFTLTTL